MSFIIHLSIYFVIGPDFGFKIRDRFDIFVILLGPANASLLLIWNSNIILFIS